MSYHAIDLRFLKMAALRWVEEVDLDNIRTLRPIDDRIEKYYLRDENYARSGGKG